MKAIKKCFVLVLTAALFCTSFMLVSCEKKITGDIDYKVSVKDALGTPYTTGIIVRFMQNGAQVAMQPVDESGAAVKTLAAGDYTIELAFTGEQNFAPLGADVKTSLTAKENALEVVLNKKIVSEAQVVYVEGEDFDMYSVEEGTTFVELSTDKRNYFLFTPTRGGTYKFCGLGEGVAVGYYGAPHFVQNANMAEVTDNAFTISVSASMIGSGDSGTSSYVIGVDSTASNGVIGIQRIGDAAKTIEDEPWTIYQPKDDIAKYTLPKNAEIKEFDLTASTNTYNLVYNEADGFYHLDTADGPLVLVRLAEDCEYIACFATMLDRSGVAKYFYNENGEFVKKESYSECLLDYIDCVDEAEGVYPLTEDLKYIIQQRGEYAGWWNVDGNSYIFKDMDGNNLTDINVEIAWLLMCCYIG